jgi:rhodanese-related sulfurtransferase
MNTSIKYLFLFFSALFFISCNANSQAGVLTATEFEQKMAEPKVQLLDVRTAGEYQTAHLPNALQANWLDQAQFADRTQYLDKSLPVLIYCASGVRSGQAMQVLKKQGFKEVYNMGGGLSTWKMEGKPVIATNPPAELTVPAFQSMINGAKVALVDIGAEWCPPCKKMEPVLQQLQKEMGSAYTFVKVDGGNDITVMKYLNFVALPTFIVFKEGKETWRKQGIVTLEELKKAISE